MNVTPSSKHPDAVDFTLAPFVKHSGVADGSAGAMVGRGWFVAATDNDNILRLYRSDGSSKLKELLDVNPGLGFPPGKNGKFRECDLEGAARIGDRIFWIGSHGRNNQNEERKERQVLFATALKGSGAKTKLKLAGYPCADLISAFLADPRLAKFGLAKAAKTKPEDKGGLNIESLCASGDQLWIGFRSPVIKGRALIVPLINVSEVIDLGRPPTLGAPLLLDLGGVGLRDMVRWGDKYLLLAGDFRDRDSPKFQPTRLAIWSGKHADPPLLLKGDLGDLNPEAVLVSGDEHDAEVQILSDDGGRSFRSARVNFVS